MHITVLQENLQKALGVVGKAVAARAQLPVLSNILIQTESGRLKLAATNLETTMTCWIGAQIEEEGSITVPARFLIDLVNSFSPDKVVISGLGSQMKLVCGESEATLTGIDASEFPPLPEVGDKKDLVLEKNVLVGGLPFVLISASTDESRAFLTGVKFLEKENDLLMVATDGYRLSVKKLPKAPGFSEGFLVPAKALAEAVRLTEGSDKDTIDVFLSRDKNQIIFSLENAQIATRLIEGDYPPFERIIPKSFTTQVIFDRTQLLRAVKFASVYAKESANILKMHIENSNVIVSANSPQVGENKTVLSVQQDGEGGDIAFNARFLLDLLAVFPDSEVQFEMSGALSPGVFKSVKDPSYLHIIMPVRVQG